MLTTNTTILRESIDQLERGRRAMMAAPKIYFNWVNPYIPKCGTAGCCIGFIALANGWRGFGDRYKLYEALSLPSHWTSIVFWEMHTGVTTKKYCYKAPLWYKYRSDNYHRSDRDAANRFMKLLITRLRHRLAVCEVEQGEWGRQLPAAQMPVGAAREQAVEQRELVTV